jgi:predicted alpha/beta hydrolase family esterase
MCSLRDRAAVRAAAGQCRFLIVPGWQGSGPGHWQSIWERKNRKFRRVEQSDWHNPRRSDWIGAIQNAIQTESKPIIVVAHSLGCIAVALWAEQANSAAQHVAGALLVAPPDFNQRTKLTEPLHDFAPHAPILSSVSILTDRERERPLHGVTGSAEFGRSVGQLLHQRRAGGTYQLRVRFWRLAGGRDISH